MNEPNRRTERITLPVTVEEHRAITKRARAVNMSTQAYLRYAALRNTLRKPTYSDYELRANTRRPSAVCGEKEPLQGAP